MTPFVLAKLHAASFSATRSWSAQEFANLLSQSGTFAVGDTSSCILIRTVLDEAEILTLATDPTKRRQGLGRTVLQKGEQQALAAGATTIFLEVAEDNTAAINLYSSAGYAQIGRRPGYYQSRGAAPIAALVMRKSLTAT